MDLFILKEIARWNRNIWRLFSLLNKEMNEYFNVKGYEYELAFRTIEIDERGIYYKLDDKYHRTDGPAMIYHNGDEEWRFNGLIHRLDGPAMIYGNGDKAWVVNGRYHRLDGPAIIYINCSTWCVNGNYHRLDGPAVEFANEDQKKIINGGSMGRR